MASQLPPRSTKTRIDYRGPSVSQKERLQCGRHLRTVLKRDRIPTDKDVEGHCLPGAESAGPTQTCGARFWSSNWRAKVYRHGARYARANFYNHGQALVVRKAKDKRPPCVEGLSRSLSPILHRNVALAVAVVILLQGLWLG